MSNPDIAFDKLLEFVRSLAKDYDEESYNMYFSEEDEFFVNDAAGGNIDDAFSLGREAECQQIASDAKALLEEFALD